jgi:putative flippase GtrA
MLGRWLRFNLVGIIGCGVQLAALWWLTHVLDMQFVLATALAVEVAVLHNFAWHELWTWPGLPAVGRWARLVRFHVANGFVSIGSNALFTWMFKEALGVPLLEANLGAIGVTAVINFGLAHMWVFRDRRCL